MKHFYVIFLLIIPFSFYAQNIGIGTPQPSEKLEVTGKVFSNEGGFKFPDGTVQETAATVPPPFSDAANKKAFIVLEMEFVNQGDVPGTDTLLAGVMEGIKVLDFEFNSLNFQGFLSKGDFRFVKEIDAGSPIIANGMATNDNFSATFHFIESTPSGNTTHYKVIITNGTILEFKNYIQYLGNGEWAHLEEIKIDYDQIELIHVSTANTFTWTF